MYFIQVVALLLLQLPSVLANGAEKSRIPLKLAVFYEEELDRYDFRCVESASEVALRYINNDSTLLPEHQLQFDVYHHFQSSVSIFSYVIQSNYIFKVVRIFDWFVVIMCARSN